MLLTALITGAALIAGVGILATYWNNIIDWLKRAITKVAEVVSATVYGSKVLIRKISEGIKEISKHYSKDSLGRWQETIVTKTIPENEVPKEIREKAESCYEYDLTDELELQLQ